MGYILHDCEVCGAKCHGYPNPDGGLIARCGLHRPEVAPPPPPQEPTPQPSAGALRSKKKGDSE